MTNQIRVYTTILSNDIVEIIDNQGDMHIVPTNEVSDWEQSLPVWENPTYSGWGDLDGPTNEPQPMYDTEGFGQSEPIWGDEQIPSSIIAS